MKTDRKGEWFIVTIPENWQGETLDDLFRKRWNGPKKQIHQIRMDKAILLNGENPNWHAPLNLGDRLQIKFFKQEAFGVTPFYIDVSVLYEDDHLLVVNKPADMDTHPNSPAQVNTLANAVAFYLQSKGEDRKVLHIHRLDRDTTGAVLFAKHSFVGALLDKMLEERKIKRTYLAMVDGIIMKKKGTIDKPIGNDRHHPTRKRVSPTGQTAITHFKVLDTFPKMNQSLVQCHLDTGRTHQIRVHLSSVHHPITGDVLYGGTSTYMRQALHAAKLEFIHPFTGKMIICYAPFLDNPPIFPEINISKVLN